MSLIHACEECELWVAMGSLGTIPNVSDPGEVKARIEQCDKVTIKLKKGEVLVFRGDMVHAGSSYQNRNIRMHVHVWWSHREKIVNTNTVD